MLFTWFFIALFGLMLHVRTGSYCWLTCGLLAFWRLIVVGFADCVFL